MDDTHSDKEASTAKSELESLLRARYQVGRQLGKGGAGIVFLVTDKGSRVKRVAKILRPSVRNVEDVTNDFKREAQRLAQLRHPNLVTVFEQAARNQTPYFVMEFVQGDQLDKGIISLVRKNPHGRWLVQLRRICHDLADVLAYLHVRKPLPLFHLDVKPENVILSSHRDSPLPVLLDFGISQFAEPGTGDVPVRGTFGMWPSSYLKSALKRMTSAGRTLFVIERKRINADLDLHLLGGTVSMALEAGTRVDSAVSTWNSREVAELQFLRDVLDRLDIDKEHQPRFASADALLESLERLESRASRIAFHLDEGFLRIPNRSVTTYGQQARKLTDWAKFQRLRGIRQLGLTYLVYPGATHTRFEHSLGVFQNAVDVLERISGRSGDFRFRSTVSDEELVATALVALLHDIGHYPFAHQFRIKGKFPSHEERTLEIMESAELGQRIVRTFNRDVYNAALALMRYIIGHENPRVPRFEQPEYPEHLRVLRDVVSSSIDVDKMDYVARDSLHAGVPYGNAVDYERFVASLRVWWDKDGTPNLLLSDKGRVCAEGLVFARYLMTSEVYWNHGVRSYAAMLTAAVGQFQPSEVHGHLWDTDEDFMHWLRKDKRSKWFGDLVMGRKPYRRAFVHQTLGGKDRAVDESLFKILEDAANGDQDYSRRIRKVVTTALRIKGAAKHEIVLDIPAGMTKIRGVSVLAEGHDEPGDAGPIFEAIGANFDGFARKARVFVHPNRFPKISVDQATSTVRAALIKEFQLS